MISRALRFGSLAGLLAAGCGHDGSSGTSGSTVSAKPAVPAESAAPSASSAPPPPPETAALPSADPVPVTMGGDSPNQPARSAVPTGSVAVLPRPAKTAAVDAGATNAVAIAASDAGAAAVSRGQQIAQQVDAIFARKNTFSAHFDQQFTPKVTGTPKDSSGTLFVERPRKLSFHYDPPSTNRIVSDGVTLKIYDGGDNQMIVTPVQNTEYPGALSFIMGKGIASSFAITIRPAAYAGTILEGKPIVPDPSYETVMFFVNGALLAKGDAGAMERLLILDAQGNKNRFTFSNAAQPAAVSPAEFTFTPPPGTNVVTR